ncbi:hypothetical protein BC829DRAFT_381753 [Chytridium lagenaria]|nr:hypothetical protein BC829DRAFT_381753 [Chytridium lagenaria]
MKQSPDSTVATGFNMIISADDLRTLRDGKWLNDEVINFYGEMLMDRSRGYPKVRRWSKKDYVIIPVHLGMHCINDSLLGRNDTLKVLRNYLEQESIDKKKKPFNLEEWKDHQPKQMNGYDCGVFTIMFAEHVSREAEFGFSQDNMPVYRKCVAYEIITSKLLDK